MNNKVALMITLIVLILLFVISFAKLFYEHESIPENMTREGTEYFNCHADQNYPFKVEGNLTTISGILRVKVGSKMTPWKAAVVNDKYLFNPLSNYLIQNFDDMEGKFVVVKGYGGKGQITMHTMGREVTINFTNAFYVSEIVGWTHVCCDTANTKNVCFWMKYG
jgi:hypothetical protein